MIDHDDPRLSNDYRALCRSVAGVIPPNPQLRILVLGVPIVAVVLHNQGHGVVFAGPEDLVAAACEECPGPAYVAHVRCQGRLVDFYGALVHGVAPPRIGLFDAIVSDDPAHLEEPGPVVVLREDGRTVLLGTSA